MTAPVDSTILLPDDTGNVGKKIRTQTKLIGGNTVHEHFFVPSPALTSVSHFFFSSTQQTAAASAQDGTSTGFFWLQMPASSTVTALIRRICADAVVAGTTAMPTSPVVSWAKFTFSGTASGASVTPLVHRTGAATNQMIVRTAVTGMTVTKGNDFAQFTLPALATGVGAIYGAKEILPFNPFAWSRGYALEIAPGEGVVVWQSVAGTASDARKFGIQMEWAELDLT